MKSEVTIIWSVESKKRLSEILNDPRWSQDDSRNMVTRIRERVESIRSFPASAPLFDPEQYPNLHRLYVEPFNVFYSFDENELHVVTLRHFKQLPSI